MSKMCRIKQPSVPEALGKLALLLASDGNIKNGATALENDFLREVLGSQQNCKREIEISHLPAVHFLW